MTETSRHWVPGRLAAQYFSVKYKTLLSLAARGRLPEGVAVVRLGRQLRFDISRVEADRGREGR
jgi:hypothetical protein